MSTTYLENFVQFFLYVKEILCSILHIVDKINIPKAVTKTSAVSLVPFIFL